MAKAAADRNVSPATVKPLCRSSSSPPPLPSLRSPGPESDGGRGIHVNLDRIRAPAMGRFDVACTNEPRETRESIFVSGKGQA